MFKKRPAAAITPASPRERVYEEAEFLAWVHETKEAAFLGAEVFERYFTIAGERMLCRVGLYWTEKANQEPRIAKIECIPAWVLEHEGK